MASIAEILLSAKPVTKTIPVCVRGDLGDRLVELRNEYDQALAFDDEHNEDPTAPAVLERIVALEAEADAATVPFVCTAMPARGEGSWKELVDAHPPLPGDEDKWRWNMDTFPVAAIAGTVSDPTMTLEQAEELAGVLSDAQFEKLWLGVLSVNLGDDLVPKSGLGLPGTPS